MNELMRLVGTVVVRCDACQGNASAASRRRGALTTGAQKCEPCLCVVANDRSAVAYQVKVGQGRADDGNATAGEVDERRIDGQRGDRGRRIGTVGRDPVLIHNSASQS